jgi:peptidoglycan/LPS O-acetylase OafA/YrhL
MNIENRHRDFFPFIHILRGLAPVIVMWAHLGPWFVMDKMDNRWAILTPWHQHVALPLHLYQNGGHFGVLIFFLVSGFIITFASIRETVGEFFIKRILRIFPALCFALVVAFAARWVALELGLGKLTNMQADGWMDFVRAFFLLDLILGKNQVIGVTWSLVSEIMFYLLTALFIARTRARPELSTYMMIGCWSAFELTAAGLPELSRMKYFSPYVAMLILGRVIYLADSGVLGWRKGLPMAALVALIFILIYTNAHQGSFFSGPQAPVASYALAIVIFLAAMTYGFDGVPKFLSFLADISLSLYLLHIPVGMLFNTVAISQGIPFALSFPVSIILCLAVSWLSFKYIEKPSQKLSRSLIAWRTGSRLSAI